MTIADRIRNTRESLGWTQDDFAKRLGYKDRSAVSKIESSGNNVTLNKIKKCADVLSVTTSYLMGWNEEAKELSDRLNYLMEYKNITKEELSFASEVELYTIENCLNCEGVLSQKEMVSISNSLNIQYGWLAGFNVPIEKPYDTVIGLTKEESVLVSKWEELTPEQQKIIMNTIDAFLLTSQK